MTIRGIDAIQFPRDIDCHAADMIKGLCTAGESLDLNFDADSKLKLDPAERLGKAGVDELKNHTWLANFNFHQLYDPNFESPLKVSSELIRSYFYTWAESGKHWVHSALWVNK